ncbi:hypothetical protein V6N11_000403 [Hibiscus sabdariffa]|uniref:RNase H type-1 domain-containing protein n=1 Tax=Hibiscus sabdariffa TaxID=183260 RepID=A0ABR2NSW1_9ROSI
MTSCDGVLRNEKGERVVGYSKKVGSCSVIETELWGILEGLNQAWRIGCRRLWVEFDCSEVVKILKRNDPSHDPFTILPHIYQVLACT